MKLTSLALFASFALAGYVEAQTTPQAPASAPTEQAPAESKAAKSHHPLSSACKKEVSSVCGSSHGQEMMGCIKENLDANKFSADCQSELKQHAKQPAKPPT